MFHSKMEHNIKSKIMRKILIALLVAGIMTGYQVNCALSNLVSASSLGTLNTCTSTAGTIATAPMLGSPALTTKTATLTSTAPLAATTTKSLTSEPAPATQNITDPVLAEKLAPPVKV